jgi:hypothetical protein
MDRDGFHRSSWAGKTEMVATSPTFYMLVLLGALFFIF